MRRISQAHRGKLQTVCKFVRQCVIVLEGIEVEPHRGVTFAGAASARPALVAEVDAHFIFHRLIFIGFGETHLPQIEIADAFERCQAFLQVRIAQCHAVIVVPSGDKMGGFREMLGFFRFEHLVRFLGGTPAWKSGENHGGSAECGKGAFHLLDPSIGCDYDLIIGRFQGFAI